MMPRRTSFEAIGTHWDIQVRDVVAESDWKHLLERVDLRIQAFDGAYSRFRPDSLVTQMSRQAGAYNLPPDGYRLLHFYKQLYEVTSGKVTPLIGQVMADAGYDAAYSFQPKQLRRPPVWEKALRLNSKTLILKRPALLDFGAAGKGYLVDIVSAMLADAGLHNYIINAGGDILSRSKAGESLSVGLENPFDTSEVVGITRLVNQSLCASSGSKRKWGKYHHVIDPTLLESTRTIIATWVIADDTMTADGIATALFFTDPALLRKEFKFSFAVLHEDMALHYSRDFPVQLFEWEYAG